MIPLAHFIRLDNSKEGARRDRFQSTLTHKKPTTVGDFGAGTLFQFSLPHRVVVVGKK